MRYNIKRYQKILANYMEYVTFFLIVLPLTIQNYYLDKREFKVIKVVNVLIGMYIFIMFSGFGFHFIYSLWDKNYLMFDEYSLFFNRLVFLIYGISSFIFSLFSIQLLLRNKSAIERIKISLPFMWIFQNVHYYFSFQSMLDKQPDWMIMIISLICTLAVYLFIFFYISRPVYKLFFININNR